MQAYLKAEFVVSVGEAQRLFVIKCFKLIEEVIMKIMGQCKMQFNFVLSLGWKFIREWTDFMQS